MECGCRMAGFAKILGKNEDIQYFDGLAASIKQSFNVRFLDTQTGQYAQGSQAAQLMSLHFGLVPDDKRALAILKLKEFIKASNGYLSTGFVSTPVLLTTLSDLGLSNEAYTMVTKEGIPSWIDMIFKKGNLVMKENWQGSLVQMPSLGGPIGYWFFSSLAGIKPTMPAFRSVEIRPDFLDSLSWVSANYQSLYGEIVSEWKRQNNRYLIHVEIPANTTAVIYLPTGEPGHITEGNEKIKGRRDMKIKEITAKETVLSVGSGKYSFVVEK